MVQAVAKFPATCEYFERVYPSLYLDDFRTNAFRGVAQKVSSETGNLGIMLGTRQKLCSFELISTNLCVLWNGRAEDMVHLFEKV